MAPSRGLISSVGFGVMKPISSNLRREDVAKRRPNRFNRLSVDLFDTVDVGLMLSSGVVLPDWLRAKIDVGEMLLPLDRGV